MEKDVKVGDIGDADLKLSGGKASATFTASKTIAGGAIKISTVDAIEVDALALLNIVKAAVEAKLPAGKVIEDFAFAEIASILSAT